MAQNEMAKLKQKYAALLAQYQEDLKVLVTLALRTGNLRTAEQAQECLNGLQA